MFHRSCDHPFPESWTNSFGWPSEKAPQLLWELESVLIIGERHRLESSMTQSTVIPSWVSTVSPNNEYRRRYDDVPAHSFSQLVHHHSWL
ncbi:MAG: hypothetical protein VX693_09145 [Pseudomonadota bacterium]|nr:hypothetical protein [Pseudomonadota bacterium]